MKIVKKTITNYWLFVLLLGSLITTGIIVSGIEGDAAPFTIGALVGIFTGIFSGLIIEEWYKNSNNKDATGFIKKKIIQYTVMFLGCASSGLLTVAIMRIL